MSAVCFQCGQVSGDPPQLNRLPDGRRCPACRDRALDLVAPALPVEPPTREPDFEQGELFPDPDEHGPA